VLRQSYLNGSLGQLTDANWGWGVAWRRFVCVIIGISAAWLFSYRKSKAEVRAHAVPPSFSAKRAIRYSYAQTIAASGSILCDILSHANDHRNHLREDLETRQKLLTWRTKLNKVGCL
jgi:hypothetical protein